MNSRLRTRRVSKYGANTGVVVYRKMTIIITTNTLLPSCPGNFKTPGSISLENDAVGVNFYRVN